MELYLTATAKLLGFYSSTTYTEALTEHPRLVKQIVLELPEVDTEVYIY